MTKRSKQCFHHCYPILLVLHVLATRCFAEEITLNVNLRKPIAVTDEKFLSLTIDPVTLLAGNALSTDFERGINLAKALTPAYVRLGGPRSSLYHFTSQNSEDINDDETIALSESDWVLTYQWAKKAGLDVIACISVDDRRQELEDATQIVSLSDHMGFNANWQLGYECQTRYNLSASDLAKQTIGLRKVLNEFPKYSRSIIIGPDVVGYSSEKQRKYLQDYFSSASPVLSAITWHPNFGSVTLDNEGAFIHQDNLEKDKEELFRVIGRFVKQPLWIAESQPEECKNLFIGALILARRLGNAAKLNVNVLMRQPVDITQPTPDYWVSLLYKTLVGREVFDARIQTNKKDHIYLYCQCTKASRRYEKGSIVIYGVNLSPENATISLKGTKVTTIHKYVLSPGFDAPNRMFAETVLLNNRSLTLIDDTIPDIQPEILNDPKGLDVQLQPGGIGFWVFPNLKVKSCMESDEASKEAFSGNGISQSLDKTEELKVHVTRSVPDQTSARNEKRKQRSDDLTRKSNVKRELKRLKKFVKQKLDDYEATTLLRNPRGSPDSKEENRESVPDAHPEDDTQRKLQGFKERLSRLRSRARSSEPKTSLKKSLSELIADAMSLMSRLQTALENAKKMTNYDDRIKSFTSVKELLRTLYDLLLNVKLNEPASEPSTAEDEANLPSKRTKRDLLLAETGQPLSLRREKKGSRNEDVKERRDDRKIKREEGIRREIQPSIVKLQSSDSGENTFYGFFEMDPIEGFPESDVYLDIESSPANGNYDRARVDERRIVEGNRRKKNSGIDYLDVEPAWMGDENDYPFYGHAEFVENLRPWNDRTRVNYGSSGEPWEVRRYGFQRDNRFGDEGEFEIVGVPISDENRKIQNNKRTWGGSDDYYESSNFPKNHRPTYGKLKLQPDGSIVRSSLTRQQLSRKMNHGNRQSPNYGLNSAAEGFDFSVASNYHGNQRSKRRNTDLHAILDQEMIDEDDANSKDCNCRVIRRSGSCGCRSKRAAIESLEVKEDMVAVPKETVILDLKKDIAHSNLRDDTDVEVFAELRDSPLEKVKLPPKPSNSKITRQIQEVPTEMKSIETPSSTGNREDFLHKILPTNPSPALNPQELEDPDQLLGTSGGDERNKFFRDQTGNTGEKEATDDITTRASSGQKNSHTFVVEKVAKETRQVKKVEKTEASKVESPSTTFKTATLSEETLREETENDYFDSKVPGGSTKRETKLKEVPEEKDVDGDAAEKSPPSSNSMQNKKRSRASSKLKSNITRPESELSKKIRALKALKDLFHELKESHAMVATPKSKSANKNEKSQRKRDDQVQKLRSNLRNKRETMLQQHEQDVRETVGKEESDEKRNLRRRKAWEVIKDSDETVDREKPAYVLMYQPIKYHSKRENVASDEVIEKIEVPVTEMVRAKNIRQRMFDPRSRNSFRDATIMEHPNPNRLRGKIIPLASLYQGQETRNERFDGSNRGNDKSYFALVEDVERPRIFYYRQKPENEGRASSPRSFFYDNGYKYNQLRQKPYRESLKAARYLSEEDQEESDELLEGREIYIIDPTEQNTGDPASRSNEVPSNFRTNSNNAPTNTHEVVSDVVTRRPYKIRRTEQHKREDRYIGSQGSQGLPKNTVELLKTLIDSLDSQTAEELFKRLSGRYVGVDGKEQNFARSITKEMEEERPGTDVVEVKEVEEFEHVSGSGENSNGSASSETLDTEVAGKQSDSYREPTVEEKVHSEEDDMIPQVIVAGEIVTDEDTPTEYLEEAETARIRKRRDTDIDSEEAHLKRLPLFLIRKAPRAVQTARTSNYLRLMESLEEMSDQSPSKLFEIVKGNEYYEVVPVRKVYGKTLPGSKERVPTTRMNRYNDDRFKGYRNLPEHLKIVIPSASSGKYPPIEENPITDGRNPNGKLREGYQEASDSEEKGSELERSEEEDVSSDNRGESVSIIREADNTNKGKDDGNDDVNLLLSNKPDRLMVLPWARRSGRLRREAEDREKIDEDVNAEKVQPLELQHLDESSSPSVPIFDRIDDVEKSLIQKIPLEKFTAKSNINKKKNIRRKKKDDEGLSSLIEKSIPKLGNVVLDSLKKAENFTGSVGKLIENLDENCNDTMKGDEQVDSASIKRINPTQNVFHNAITNVKKFFVLLSGVTHLLRG